MFTLTVGDVEDRAFGAVGAHRTRESASRGGSWEGGEQYDDAVDTVEGEPVESVEADGTPVDDA